MSSFNIGELNKLVQDGIQTIEFLQQGKEDIQKTYGRSAIQQPGTRARVAAWESINPNHDNTGGSDKGDEGIPEGGDKTKGKGNPPDDGRYGNQSQGYWVFPPPRKEASDQSLRNAENPNGNISGIRGTSSGGFQEAGTGEHPNSSGNQEFEGYNADGSVDAGEYHQIMSMDHEMSAGENHSPDYSGARIRNATTDDFAAVFEEGAPKVHKRLRGITAAATTPLPGPSASNPVKKGTDESTVSTLLGDVPLSGNGAIHNVHQSLLLQPNSDAHAEDAQGCVQDVSATGSTTQSNAAACNCEKIEGKIDLLVREVEAVGKKLDCLPEIKEEIKNINKKITNLSLGLSTVENYIKSMMIIIPGSGKDNSSQNPDVNPDLKAVIGRDRTRGLKEVTAPRSDLETLDQVTGYEGRIDEKYLTKNLDFTRPNAANFVPTQDTGSFYTIVSMIRDEVRDIKKQNELITWATQAMDDVPMEELYAIVKEALAEFLDQDPLSDNE
ncbi:phosphoprotein [Ninomys virus]|nr:phosphoprotein [Ninomys virus]